MNTIRMALEEFQKLGMIHIEKDFIAILNWEKHQSVDKMELIKEQNRQRQVKHRDKQKKLLENNVTVTLHNAADIELDKNKIKNKSKENIPPTLEELKKYIDEKKLLVHPAKFLNYYESKGWMIGKNKMKDWKAAARGWHIRESEGKADNRKRMEDLI